MIYSVFSTPMMNEPLDYRGIYDDVTAMLLRVSVFNEAIKGTIFEDTALAKDLSHFYDECNDYLNHILRKAHGIKL